jgi:putative ABC transport system ATP-binding protein
MSLNSHHIEEANVVHMHGIRFKWPGSRSFSIEIDDFTVKRGERLLLSGPSGSGKSTLLSLLAGIMAPATGCIEVLGTDITTLGSAARDRFRAEHYGIIFQMFNLLPYGAVIDNVVLPLSFAPKRRKRTQALGGEAEQARHLLSALGLEEEFLSGAAASLSVGQQQRVAAARALIGAPELIIADEPTSALDRDHREKFLDLLFRQVADAGASLIMVSHEEDFANHFDRVVHLEDLIKKRSS